DLDDSNFHSVVFTILPALITIGFFALIKTTLNYFGYDGLSFEWLVSLLKKASGLAATILFDFISQLMWFFGIHGNNVLEEVNVDFFTNASQINSALVAAGKAPTQIFTKQFLDIFVFIGGSGSTLCLLFALALTRKKNQFKNLVKIYLIPGLFNINEIVIFGLPIVLNPIFFIPFLLTPIVLTFTTYISMATGIVPLTINNNIQWTTPIIMGGYLATNSISGAVLQVVNLIIGILIYLPFVKLSDKNRERNNKKIFDNFISDVMENKIDTSTKLTALDGDFGRLARTLTKDLEEELKNNKGSLYLVYQPQVNESGNVIGCEALLRWKTKHFGHVPPPVIVRLAEEKGLTNRLGDKVIQDAIEELASLNKNGINNIIMSVNISANQIEDGKFVDTIKKHINKTGVTPSHLEFELTENAAILVSIKVKECLKKLRILGCRIAVDDFGMGYTSINYLKEFKLSTVKIDGSLVEDIVENINGQEIIASLCDLCDSLNLDIIAEFVETLEQRDVLERI
ncbi:MAG: PTS sugar transporter subunit IIC/EAL domain-containing protein, partial [Clostridiales bacterium]|nr:PTS sugar transporter subunit IIC/EAL domain-containing protein [Clostridiales bacterium]